MKTIYRIFTLIFITGTLIIAQDFSFENHDILVVDSLNSEMIFEFTLTNNSSSEITVSIIRTINELPDNWTSSLCFDLCYPPFLDSISTTDTFGSFPLSPGESREASLHVFPLVNNGTAALQIKAKLW